MRCKYCGENIEKDYKYCIGCGKPTEDSIKDYLKEEEKSDENIEYFEIEVDKTEEEHYDFTEFLKEEEIEDEEIEFSTDNNKTRSEEIEYDNLEDTKKRILFERSDFKVFDKFKREKERIIIDKESGEQYSNGTKYNREYQKENSNYFQDKFSNNKSVKIDKTKARLRRKRLGKQIRNIFYNIIVLIIVGILSIYLQGEFTQLLNYTGISFFFYLSDYMIIIGIFLLTIFLLTPFFICKGNAKIPLLFFSILISWTLIGWIILFVIALTSNNKWQIRIIE